MCLRVVVRPPAESDLLQSALFIAEDNPAAARRFLDVSFCTVESGEGLIADDEQAFVRERGFAALWKASGT